MTLGEYRRNLLTIQPLLLLFSLLLAFAAWGCGGAPAYEGGSTKANVVLPQSTATMSVSPGKAAIAPGQKLQFIATVNGGGNQTASWSVRDGGGSISSEGLYSAPAATGSATIRAVSLADSSVSAVAQVTITEEPTRLLAISPSTVAFGEVVVGNGTPMAVTLINAGTLATTVFSGSTAGAGFSVGSEDFPFTLPAGSSATTTVVFKPQSGATVTGGVSFLSDAADSPTTAKLTGTGTTVSSYTVTLTWHPSSSVVVGYNVYRAQQPGLAFIKVNHLIEPGMSYDDASVGYGTTYQYVVKAVDTQGRESVPSNVVTVSVPAS